MVDDNNATSAHQRQRINADQFYEVREWSAKFGVTPEELRKAIRAVGVWAGDVEAYLKGNQGGSESRT